VFESGASLAKRCIVVIVIEKSNSIEQGSIATVSKNESEDKIARAMEHVTSKRLGVHTRRDKRLTFHLSDEEFEEIKATAEALDYSISDYFHALHCYAVKRLAIESSEADWVHPSARHQAPEED
jgi:hypothetical protein